MAGKASRKVFHIYVFGDAQCGKSTLLRWLIGKEREEHHVPTVKERCTCASVIVERKECYLVMHEFGSKERDIIHEAPQEEEDHIVWPRMQRECDLALFLYDSSNRRSFSVAAQLQAEVAGIFSDMPCLFVATKSDKMGVEQDLVPVEYCRGLDIPDPPEIGDLSHAVFGTLVQTAMYGDIAIPGHRRVFSEQEWTRNQWIVVGMVGALLSVVGFVWMRR